MRMFRVALAFTQTEMAVMLGIERLALHRMECGSPVPDAVRDRFMDLYDAARHAVVHFARAEVSQ